MVYSIFMQNNPKINLLSPRHQINLREVEKIGSKREFLTLKIYLLFEKRQFIPTYPTSHFDHRLYYWLFWHDVHGQSRNQSFFAESD